MAVELGGAVAVGAAVAVVRSGCMVVAVAVC